MGLNLKEVVRAILGVTGEAVRGTCELVKNQDQRLLPMSPESGKAENKGKLQALAT